MQVIGFRRLSDFMHGLASGSSRTFGKLVEPGELNPRPLECHSYTSSFLRFPSFFWLLKYALFLRLFGAMTISGDYREFLFGGSAVVPWMKTGSGAMRDRRITKRLVDSLETTGAGIFHLG